MATSFDIGSRGVGDVETALLLLFFFLDPGTQFSWNEKNYAMQYKKYKNQAVLLLLLLLFTPILNS